MWCFDTNPDPVVAISRKVKIKNVKNLAFKGGSVKGIAYLGCIQALQEVGVELEKIEKVIGTSAGAITALLVSLNLNSAKLEEYLDQDFTHFLDLENQDLKQKIVTLTDASKVKKSGTASAASSEYSFKANELGLAKKGENFRDWMERVILEHTKIPYCTFQDLAEAEARFKDLHVVAFDLTAKRPLIYSKTRTPNAIISDAIRSSMSMPFIYEPHKFYCNYTREGGVIRRVSRDMEKNHLVDGGIALNYPIQVFDEPNSTRPGESLGFYLTSPNLEAARSSKFIVNDVEDEALNKLIKRQTKASNGLAYWFDVWKCSKAQGKKHMKYEKNRDRTIYVNNLGIGIFEFNIGPVKKTNLIEEGKKAVEKYFKDELSHETQN